jgi:tetratricopeptide (TPR) repeat protein
MSRHRLWVAAVLLLAGMGFGSIAEAQRSRASAPAPATRPENSERDEKARQLFSAGVVAYSEGHYENALENYRLAFEMSDRPELLFNVGIAAERLRRDQEAFDAFTLYLERVPAAENRPFVEERLAVLRHALDQAQAQAAEPAPVQSAPDAALAPDTTAQNDSGGLLTKWWFWGIVGVAAVAVTTTVVIASSGPDYQSGDVGGVVTTLVAQ